MSLCSPDEGYVSLMCLNGVDTLKHLEKLSLSSSDFSKESLEAFLRGRKHLREQFMSLIPHSYAVEVVAALPESLECLDIDIWNTAYPRSNWNEQMRIISRLSNLKNLILQVVRGDFDWLQLLPAAARLSYFGVTVVSCCDDGLVQFIRAATNLKSLELFEAHTDCENLLIAISSLPNLECLWLHFGCNYIGETRMLTLNSEIGLLALTTSQVRRSMLTCSIRLSQRDAKRTEVLLQSFRENFSTVV